MKIAILMPVSYMDVINMVKKVPLKSCELDPIPTKILKNHIDALAHGVANIINTSFKHGYMLWQPQRCNHKTITEVTQTGPHFSKFQTCLKTGIPRQASQKGLWANNLWDMQNLWIWWNPFNQLTDRVIPQKLHCYGLRLTYWMQLLGKRFTCLMMLDLSAAFW